MEAKAVKIRIYCSFSKTFSMFESKAHLPYSSEYGKNVMLLSLLVRRIQLFKEKGAVEYKQQFWDWFCQAAKNQDFSQFFLYSKLVESGPFEI